MTEIIASWNNLALELGIEDLEILEFVKGIMDLKSYLDDHARSCKLEFLFSSPNSNS